MVFVFIIFFISVFTSVFTSISYADTLSFDTVAISKDAVLLEEASYWNAKVKKLRYDLKSSLINILNMTCLVDKWRFSVDNLLYNAKSNNLHLSNMEFNNDDSEVNFVAQKVFVSNRNIDLEDFFLRVSKSRDRWIVSAKRLVIDDEYVYIYSGFFNVAGIDWPISSFKYPLHPHSGIWFSPGLNSVDGLYFSFYYYLLVNDSNDLKFEPAVSMEKISFSIRYRHFFKSSFIELAPQLSYYYDSLGLLGSMIFTSKNSNNLDIKFFLATSKEYASEYSYSVFSYIRKYIPSYIFYNNSLLVGNSYFSMRLGVKQYYNIVKEYNALFEDSVRFKQKDKKKKNDIKIITTFPWFFNYDFFSKGLGLNLQLYHNLSFEDSSFIDYTVSFIAKVSHVFNDTYLSNSFTLGVGSSANIHAYRAIDGCFYPFVSNRLQIHLHDKISLFGSFKLIRPHEESFIYSDQIFNIPEFADSFYSRSFIDVGSILSFNRLNTSLSYLCSGLLDYEKYSFSGLLNKEPRSTSFFVIKSNLCLGNLAPYLHCYINRQVPIFLFGIFVHDEKLRLKINLGGFFFKEKYDSLRNSGKLYCSFSYDINRRFAITVKSVLDLGLFSKNAETHMSQLIFMFNFNTKAWKYSVGVNYSVNNSSHKDSNYISRLFKQYGVMFTMELNLKDDQATLKASYDQIKNKSDLFMKEMNFEYYGKNFFKN